MRISEDRATPISSNGEPSQFTKRSSASIVPAMVQGDWVLFHPVYSPEELKAVQVQYLDQPFFKYPLLIHKLLGLAGVTEGKANTVRQNCLRFSQTG